MSVWLAFPRRAIWPQNQHGIRIIGLSFPMFRALGSRCLLRSPQLVAALAQAFWRTPPASCRNLFGYLQPLQAALSHLFEHVLPVSAGFQESPLSSASSIEPFSGPSPSLTRPQNAVRYRDAASHRTLQNIRRRSHLFRHSWHLAQMFGKFEKRSCERFLLSRIGH